MSAALEFLELARERRFDGSRLRALRDLLGGLGSVFGGFGLATIDDPGAVALVTQLVHAARPPWCLTHF